MIRVLTRQNKSIFKTIHIIYNLREKQYMYNMYKHVFNLFGQKCITIIFVHTKSASRTPVTPEVVHPTAMGMVESLYYEIFGSFVRSADTTLRQITPALGQLLELIYVLHSVGLYHGNLSIRNVFITRNGQVRYDLMNGIRQIYI